MKLWWLLIGGFLVAILMGRKFVEPHIETMARAIMEFEGWGPGSVSERNNNPGNLKYAGQPGSAQDQYGHAVFSTFEDGWNALINQLRISFNGTSRVYKPEDTLYEFFGKYSEANSVEYAQFVAGKLEVNPSVRLKGIG